MPPPSRPRRDPAVDAIRALALGRVVVYHALGSPAAMTWVASMPVLFFLGGDLMRSSLERKGPLTAVRSRFRRLLVPLAPFAAAALVATVVGGYGGQLRAVHVIGAFCPLFGWPTPSGPAPATSALGWTWISLWYVQSYLAFTLLSPLLAWTVRRLDARVVAAGAAALWLVGVGFGVGRLATHLLAWTAGLVAPGVRTLVERRPTAARAVVAVSMGAGTAVFALRSSETAVGASTLLLGAGWIGLALLCRPALARFGAGVARSLVDRVNSHAVSIYLWHLPAIALVRALVPATRSGGLAAQGLLLVAVLGVTATAAALARPFERWGTGRAQPRAEAPAPAGAMA